MYVENKTRLKIVGTLSKFELQRNVKVFTDIFLGFKDFLMSFETI